MQQLSWQGGIFPVLDFETTSVNPREARAVSVAFSLITPNGHLLPGSINSIISPEDFEVPAEAAAVHGITTERAMAEGEDPHDVFTELFRQLQALRYNGWPLIIYNAPYDWPLAMLELARYDVCTVPEITRLVNHAFIIDPLVMDRALNKRFTKGAHKLENACAYYGVPMPADAAHDALHDTQATAKLLRVLVRRFPKAFEGCRTGLMERQQKYHELFKQDLATYFAGKGNNPEAAVNIRAEAPWPGMSGSDPLFIDRLYELQAGEE